MDFVREIPLVIWKEIIAPNPGSWATAIVGFFAVLIAYRSYRANRGVQRFENAIHTYRKYLELAVQYPRLAEPDDYDQLKGEDFGRYEWFVGIVLRACEELVEYITKATRDQPEGARVAEWQYTVVSTLKQHVRYFNESEWFNTDGRKVYSQQLVRLIDAVRSAKVQN
jgi:hypothetical protein